MGRVYVRQGNHQGSVEHYWHFLAGYLIPFLKEARNDEEYVFRDCGPVMNPHLLDIPGIKTEIGTRETCQDEINPQGHDRQDLPRLQLEWIRSEMPQILGAKKEALNTRILVVDRARPHPFYMERAEIRTSGAIRRSVPNMREIHESISREIPSDLVALEEMSLKEQIALFQSRTTFVMQHGAAMGNLLWAPRGSRLIEIRSPGQEDYFAHLVRILGIRRETVHQAHNHAPVDPARVKVPKAA